MSAESLAVETADLDVMPLFATPVVRCYWPDSDALNEQLKSVILKRMQESPGVVRTNRGGWHSEGNLQTWPEDCVKSFMARLNWVTQELVKKTVPNPLPEHLANWHIVSWANVNRKGSFNRAHHHDGFGNLWSGFYYVDTGQRDPSQNVKGHTILQDRSGAPKEILLNPDPFEREVRIKPKVGLMILFPGRQYHHVEPYEGDAVRITIAFNLKHLGFTIPYYEGMQEQNWWWTNFRGLMIIPRKVPEKLRALAILVRMLRAGNPRESHGGLSWGQYLKMALDQATAEASAPADLSWGRVTPGRTS